MFQWNVGCVVSSTLKLLVSACFLVSQEEVVRLAMQLISCLLEGDPRLAMKILV